MPASLKSFWGFLNFPLLVMITVFSGLVGFGGIPLMDAPSKVVAGLYESSLYFSLLVFVILLLINLGRWMKKLPPISVDDFSPS